MAKHISSTAFRIVTVTILGGGGGGLHPQNPPPTSLDWIHPWTIKEAPMPQYN